MIPGTLLAEIGLKNYLACYNQEQLSLYNNQLLTNSDLKKY